MTSGYIQRCLYINHNKSTRLLDLARFSVLPSSLFLFFAAFCSAEGAVADDFDSRLHLCWRLPSRSPDRYDLPRDYYAIKLIV